MGGWGAISRMEEGVCREGGRAEGEALVGRARTIGEEGATSESASRTAFHGSLAQLVECALSMREVPGSKPGRSILFASGRAHQHATISHTPAASRRLYTAAPGNTPAPHTLRFQSPLTAFLTTPSPLCDPPRLASRPPFISFSPRPHTHPTNNLYFLLVLIYIYIHICA